MVLYPRPVDVAGLLCQCLGGSYGECQSDVYPRSDPWDHTGQPTNDRAAHDGSKHQPHQNPADVRRTAGRSACCFRSTVGSIPFELSPVDQDTWLEAALGGTWATVTGTATATITTNQAGRTYTRATGSFITDGFLPGDYVSWTGLVQSASNGRHTIASVTATIMTVVESIGANETSVAGCACSHPGRRLLVGTTLRTFTVERRWSDITQFQPFTGVAVNNVSLSITPENIVSGSYDLIGMNFGALSGTSLDATPTAASTVAPYDGFVGALHEGNAVLGLITSFTLQVNNGRALQPVLFTSGSPDVYNGIAEVTGSVSVLFQDATMLNKFINETQSSLNLRMDDLAGVEFMRVYIPSLIYTGGESDPPQNGPAVLNMPFQANPDATTGTNLLLQRSNA
jgi:hypothetical protein